MPRLSTTLASFNPIVTAKAGKANVFAARVKFSMIDDKTQSQVFKDFGEWSSIGCIFFDRLNQPNSNPKFTSDNFAKPLFPNNSNIPLHNELVYIMALPNSSVQSDVNNLSYYYFQPINIWNSTHHNAIPDPIYGDANPESQQADYQQTEAGSVRRVTDGGTEIDLGNNFQEKLEVRNLQPYAGDLIYQGRWGQTLRFGSTIQGAQIPNPWSNAGADGDPITILKNGQHEDSSEPWIPQVEDINTDKSSIYLTSTQEIPIDLASKNYKSYNSSPEAAPKFTGEQVIINSGRLLFNSKTDNILLSSFDTINLNSVNLSNIACADSVTDFDTVGTILRDPFAPFTKSPNVSNESASNVITLIGIPTPGGTDVGTGIALITLTAASTVVTILSVVLTVLSTLENSPNTFCRAD